MNPPQGLTFRQRSALALHDQGLRIALDRATTRFVEMREAGLRSLPEAEALRDEARAIRARTLARLDQGLLRFEAALIAAGGQVHWADDGPEAVRHVLRIARAHGVRRVVKSKSMLSEEIRLTAALGAAEIEVVESDLGEYVIQLADETPSHIIAPALHKTKEQIGALLHEKLGIPLTHDPARMTAAARAKLRDVYLTADMGISGVNFGVADTGTLCIVTNEGNASLGTSAPRLHVALLGIERLVESLDDLSVMLRLLARSATGQKLSVYTDLITGPRRRTPGDPDGPDELHVVLIDNGRSRVLGSELHEILYCIRCGACLNTCPVYREIGGHAYGSVYSGPVGAVVTPALLGIGPWAELPRASSLCGACRDVCPVRIDIPRLLLALRQRSYRLGGLPLALRLSLRLYRLAATHPRVFRAATSFARRLTRTLSPGGFFRHLPWPLNGWTAHRDFPTFAAEPFSVLFKQREKRP